MMPRQASAGSPMTSAPRCAASKLQASVQPNHRREAARSPAAEPQKAVKLHGHSAAVLGAVLSAPVDALGDFRLIVQGDILEDLLIHNKLDSKAERLTEFSPMPVWSLLPHRKLDRHPSETSNL